VEYHSALNRYRGTDNSGYMQTLKTENFRETNSRRETNIADPRVAKGSFRTL